MGGNKNWRGAVDGAAQAAQHANDVRAGWEDAAFELFASYVANLKFAGTVSFLTEDVVQLAETTTPPLFAPDNRAWGHIAMRAKRAGLIESIGMAYSKKGGGHSAPRTVWKPL